MSFTIFSFGFRYGAPEADEVFDLRCLKNPYWEPELRELCSQDALCAILSCTMSRAAPY